MWLSFRADTVFINYDTGDVVSNVYGSRSVTVERSIGPQTRLAMLDAPPFTTGAEYYPEVIGQEPYPQIPKGRWIMKNMIGTANGRAQSYGSSDKSSIWVDTQYDLEGVSDYVPISGEVVFSPEEFSQTIIVETTGDYITETPDETIMVRLSLPGMLPSLGGQLWSTITIEDDGDGGSGIHDYSDILYASDPVAAAGYGKSVSISDSADIAIIGAPETTESGKIHSGAAYVFRRVSGIWVFEAKLQPADGALSAQRFAASVVVDAALGTTRAVVGAPGRPAAYVFVRSGTSWTQESKLTAAAATSAGHHFADTVALSGDIAVVGAAELEAIYVYERLSSGWGTAQLFRSPDYDYDQVNVHTIIHRASFGHSVGVSARTIVAGAPLAEYGNRGTTGVDTTDTRSVDNSFFGKGAVYTWYKTPAVQTVQIRFDTRLTEGNFALSLTHRGVTATTENLISYQATAVEVKDSLEALSNIDTLKVFRSGNTEDGFVWTITFFSEVDSVPLLVPTWNGDGCVDCDAFNDDYTADPTQQIIVTELVPLGAWTFHGKLTAPDANPSDRFGHAIDIDQNQIIVGAHSSSTLVTTSWNFESGDLVGWFATGTAFAYQPTFGDNSYARNVYDGYETFMEGAGQTAWHEGRYWVGTYENRPGKGRNDDWNTCSFSGSGCRAENYKKAGTERPGNTQGDGPQGTLTSQAFQILGDTISFRIGGGCDDRYEYVSLLVDGIERERATGTCRETMRIETWDTSPYYNQTALIHVVDAASSNWGHINFDDVQFSWDTVNTASSSAGVAYMFRRKASGSTENECSETIEQSTCEWQFQTRLIASDKRDGDHFGYSVAVDDTLGIAAVGAFGHHRVDINNTAIRNSDGTNQPSAGAVYVYTREAQVLDGLGDLVTPPKWAATEHAKLQGLHGNMYDAFGTSLSLDSSSLVIGSPGFDYTAENTGVGYVYDVMFYTIGFTLKQVNVLENRLNRQIDVTVKRSGSTARAVAIGYATSDKSAVGVDATQYTACLALPLHERKNCGDYQHVAGELVFGIGESSKQVTVPIMDDECYEHDKEYFQIHLHLPGGVALIGDSYSIEIRIDDNDFGKTECN